MKETIKAAGKLVITLIVINAALDVLDMFGFSIARQVVNSPLSLFIKKPAPAAAA